jgi:hypothetical protein
MADLEKANYLFLPWVRQGAAASIQTPDSLGTTEQAGVVSVTVKLRLNQTPEIAQQVRLYGPGDIVGIDPQQVVRTEPRHMATDFEPNYFAAVEFDRPDFPWLFTPARANDEGRLRPWLCLVVVRKQPGVTLTTDRNRPLPVLTIAEPAKPALELPDLSESWAWVHAQVTGSLPNDVALKAALSGDPALTLSRLLSPRRLDPATDYLACVVPTFELGRKAGLGLPVEASDEQAPSGLAPAWTLEAPIPSLVTLPVYYHWEFRTGTGADFETLARLLTARVMPSEVGKRPIDISQPGFDLDPALPAGTTVELEGALRLEDSPVAEWSQETRAAFQDRLKEILNAPWQAMKEGMAQEEQEPLLAPPIYGCWQAAKHTVEITSDPTALSFSPRWLHELNLDPRYRAVAALGTKVVQAQQEQLVASAWEQLGEIKRANQLLRQAQLGRAVNSVYYTRHLSRFAEETVLKVVALAQSRLVVETTGSNNEKTRAILSQLISRSAIPDAALSAPLRRLASPRSAISTRFKTVGTRPIALMANLNTSIPLVPNQRKPAGWVTIDQVSEQANEALRQSLRFERVSSSFDSARQLASFQIAAEGNAPALLTAIIDPAALPAGVADSDAAAAFRQAAQAHQAYINQKVLRTIWQNYKMVFAGSNGIIYGVDHRGRLRFYRDHRQDGTAEMPTSLIIGQGGWLQFKFLFSGGDGIIYAVDQSGRLLFYRDKTQDGTGDVANPSTIGQGRWQDFRFVFSGGNGIIYTVQPGGQLQFYRDEQRDGTGDVANPKTISQGGWQDFRFVFSGGNGTLYAVDQEGRLLFTRDMTQDGSGVVAAPSVIGQGGWQNFAFVFSGGNGILYAIDQEGRLLHARDETQDGSGNVALPSPTAQGKTIFPASPVDLSILKDALLHSVNPEKTINARVRASLPQANGTLHTNDSLEPILDTPIFPQPMYEALRDLAQDLLFPGLEHVLPNTVTLLETNPAFVEAFLIGLNAEMSHELLWRGYPIDQRGTYFRQFWDGSELDIEAIKEWGNTGLGENAHSGESLVLLIRGELLRRYPNAVIYAVEAVRDGEQLKLLAGLEHELHPLFRGTLKPDTNFLGFPLTRTVAIGNLGSGHPGWFFVIQEQPTEPRFGLDAADFGVELSELTTWNDLSWRHLAKTEEELAALSHASLKTKPQPPVINKVEWGKNAAHQAFITLQRPVRIAIHAREMIP